LDGYLIQPRLRKGANEYTKECIALNQKFLDDSGLFVQTKDPITRWFFKNKINPLEDNQIVKNMLGKATESPSLVSQFVLEKPVNTPSIKETDATILPKKAMQSHQYNKQASIFKNSVQKKRHILTPTFVDTKNIVTSLFEDKVKKDMVKKEAKRSLSGDILKLKGLLENSTNPFHEIEQVAT
jgi:hypothetical protein